MATATAMVTATATAMAIATEPHQRTNYSNPHAPQANERWLIVKYYSHQIIINSMQMMMLMVENTTCLLGMPANNETIAQRHGACPDCARGPEEYLGLIRYFVQ